MGSVYRVRKRRGDQSGGDRVARYAVGPVQQARQEGTDLQLAGSAAAQEAVVSASLFIPRRLGLFGYLEFLEAVHRRGGEEAVEEYLLRGAFPECCRPGRTASLLSLYDLIVNRDVLITKGVRDRVTLCRIALFLLTATGGGVTANAVRNQLKVKSVSTVTEHMEHLERAGLVGVRPHSRDDAGRAGRQSPQSVCGRYGSCCGVVARRISFPRTAFCDHDP